MLVSFRSEAALLFGEYFFRHTNILYVVLRSDVPRQLLPKVFSLFLWIGIIMAAFESLGKTSCSHIRVSRSGNLTHCEFHLSSEVVHLVKIQLDLLFIGKFYSFFLVRIPGIQQFEKCSAQHSTIFCWSVSISPLYICKYLYEVGILFLLFLFDCRTTRFMLLSLAHFCGKSSFFQYKCFLLLQFYFRAIFFLFGYNLLLRFESLCRTIRCF